MTGALFFASALFTCYGRSAHAKHQPAAFVANNLFRNSQLQCNTQHFASSFIEGEESEAPAAKAKNSMRQTTSPEVLKSQILELLGANVENGHRDPKVREELSSLLHALREETGGTNDHEMLFEIGRAVCGVELPPPEEDDRDRESDETQKPAPSDGSAILDFDFMKTFMKDVFESYGLPPERAETSADVLVEADRRGIHSHGLGRLKPIYCDRMDAGILRPSAPIDFISETDTTALLDGNLGTGLYVGPYAMNIAIEKAKKHGVGFVAVRNSTHYGIAGYYALMATKAGCVGMTGTNARPSIAPTYGVQPMLGTNPLCFGIPSDEKFPFVIDCATSINQRGKIEKYAREGVETPRGAVIDNEGVQRTDTVGILKDLVSGKCALTPLGGAGVDLAGYKGYGWATVVELLSTAFQSGPFGKDISGVDPKSGEKKPMPLGHCFLAIDVEALCPLQTFQENTGSFLRALRASKKSPKGPGQIWTAGEVEHDAFLAQTEQGGMKVPKSLLNDMLELRDNRQELQEKYRKFPFE